MSSDMERALDEILSGVNELLVKAPSRLGEPSERLTGLPIPAHSSDDTAGLLSLLAHLESDPNFAGRALARRWLNRTVLERAAPLTTIAGVPAGLRVSPQMGLAVARLAALGATWLGAEGSEMYWDCGLLSNLEISAALGHFIATVRLDPERQNRILCLPRTPERMPVMIGEPSHLCPSVSVGQLSQVAIVDQDKNTTERATIFWLAQSDLAPHWLCGMTLRAGQLIPVVNPLAKPFSAASR